MPLDLLMKANRRLAEAVAVRVVAESKPANLSVEEGQLTVAYSLPKASAVMEVAKKGDLHLKAVSVTPDESDDPFVIDSWGRVAVLVGKELSFLDPVEEQDAYKTALASFKEYSTGEREDAHEAC